MPVQPNQQQSEQRRTTGRLMLHGHADRAAGAVATTVDPRGQEGSRDGAHRVALVRIGFGLIWAIDAWYKWHPAFINNFSKEISRPAQSAPAVLKPWFQFWQHLITPHATFFAVCTALLETVLAAGLILGLGRRSLYAAGAVFSFLIWAVPETFGRIWERGQTDIGTSSVYVFIFLALLIVDARANAGGWSLDRRLEKRLPWWRSVAEFPESKQPRFQPSQASLGRAAGGD